jgi:predicted transcriptional regulator
VARPSKYKDIDLKKVQLLAEKGFTEDEIAEFFGICKASVTNYKQEHPEFLAAIKAGKKISDEKVERSLFERACGYEHPEEKIFCSEGCIVTHQTTKKYPPDPTAMIFWLKNRKPKEWRDKQEVEHSGKLTYEHFKKEQEDFPGIK